VSASLYGNVTRYHAQIGANVNKDALQQLEWNLLAEAKQLFHQRKFEQALNTFTHCLAVTEKTRSAQDHAVRGAVLHNIASCLHNLGEMEAAQVRRSPCSSMLFHALPCYAMLCHALPCYAMLCHHR
jgi:hypothetical protein